MRTTVSCGAWGLVTDAHPEGIPCSGLVSHLLAGLDGKGTAAGAIAQLCEGMEPGVAQQAELAAMQALELLYVDGAITD